jgi:hypothetical protein
MSGFLKGALGLIPGTLANRERQAELERAWQQRMEAYYNESQRQILHAQQEAENARMARIHALGAGSSGSASGLSYVIGAGLGPPSTPLYPGAIIGPGKSSAGLGNLRWWEMEGWGQQTFSDKRAVNAPPKGPTPEERNAAKRTTSIYREDPEVGF